MTEHAKPWDWMDAYTRHDSASRCAHVLDAKGQSVCEVWEPTQAGANAVAKEIVDAVNAISGGTRRCLNTPSR